MKLRNPILVLILCLLCACTGRANPPSVQRITAETAYQMMRTSNDFILLDVRTAQEFQARHIAEAILIPVNELAERAARELPDKNALIFVYCQAGRRSADAANILAEKGYTQIYDIGGIANWPFN